MQYPSIHHGTIGITLCACLGLSGCDATGFYESLARQVPPTGVDLRGTPPGPDMRGGGGGGDGPIVEEDMNTGGMGEKVLSRGSFEDRAGHFGRGTASLVRLQDGSHILRFEADTNIGGVPGPFVFLTSRADMGRSINSATDIDLGSLKALKGLQTYPLPAGAHSGRPYAFVYCKPFSVEVARAELQAVP